MPLGRRLSWSGEFPEEFRFLRIGRRNSTANPRENRRCQRGTTYKSVDDVSTREITACRDVWEKLGETLGRQFKFESVDINGLWDLVFEDGWTTADSAGERPEPAPRDDSKLIVLVGKWMKDLPKASDDMPDIEARRKYRAAYVKYMCTSDDHIFGSTFTFCDRHGQEGPQSAIEFLGERYNYLGKAVARFEQHEMERLKTFNEDLAVYIVRRRLQLWSREGFKHSSADPYGRDDDDVRFYITDPEDMQAFREMARPMAILHMMAEALTEYNEHKTEHRRDRRRYC